MNFRRLLIISSVVMLLAGMKAWGEPANRHPVKELLNAFQDSVNRFEEGLADSRLKGNLSVSTLLLKRSLLLLKSVGDENSELRAFGDFPAFEQEIRTLIDKKSGNLTIKDLEAAEKAILTSKQGKALIENGTVGKLADLVRLEMEKRISPESSSKELLGLMARTKLTALPQGWEVGQDTPLFLKINNRLKLLAEMKGTDLDGPIPPPTLADLKQALENGSLKLSREELLELNASLAPIQIRLKGGFAAEDTLRELFRNFSERVPANRKRDLPDFDSFLDLFADAQPKPEAGGGGLRPLGSLPSFGGGRRSGGGGATSGGGSGFFSNNFPGGGTPRFALDPNELALTGKQLSPNEKECLTSAKAKNYELTMSLGGAGLTACSSTPVALDPEVAKASPKPTDREGQCEVNLFTAKHCVEGPFGAGNLQGIEIEGVNEPITRAQVLVEDETPSVTGGNDSAVIRVEMSCEAAKRLSYQKPATSSEAAFAMEPREGTALLIARNRQVNVEPGGSNTLFARGYLTGGHQKFSGFAVTQDASNRSQVVKTGDSGGFQIGCVNGKPKLFGATSTVLVTGPNQQGGRLGRAASLASLDWLNRVLRSSDVPPSTNLIANAVRDKKIGAGSSSSPDKSTHPGI